MVQGHRARHLSLPVGWDDIREHRIELYGLAIISVIVFHYFEWVDKSGSDMLALVARWYNILIGSVGVDVFAFLSGFSIWHALSKGQRLSTFYMRRMRRVVMPYLVLGVVFWFVKDVVLLGLPLTSFLIDLSCVSFWSQGVRTVWYVPFIVAVYLVSPAIYQVLKREVSCGVLVGVYVVSCVALFVLNPEYFSKIEIALLRVPVFVVGMWCGKLACGGFAVPSWVGAPLVLSVPAQVACGFVSFPFKRLVASVYAIGLVVLGVWACKTAQRHNAVAYPERWWRRLLASAGQASFELYLTHVMLRDLCAVVGIDVTVWWRYALCVAASVVLVRGLLLLESIGTGPRGAHFRRASG